MSNTSDTNEALENARKQGVAQVESIVEMIGELKSAETDEEREDARQRIYSDPLSVQVRSGWTDPNDAYHGEGAEKEYKILLCTGGPACRIIGKLGEFSRPDSARVEVQGWFTEWKILHISREEREAVLEYARQFWFGE